MSLVDTQRYRVQNRLIELETSKFLITKQLADDEIETDPELKFPRRITKIKKDLLFQVESSIKTNLFVAKRLGIR